MVDHLNKFIKQDSTTTHKPHVEQEQATPEVNPLVDLQRLVGNQGVQRMLNNGQLTAPQQPTTFIQTKLSVGAADDMYEREADSVAQQVVHGAGPDTAQREEMPEEEMALKRMDIQREEMPEEEEMALKRDVIQRQGLEGSFDVGGDLEDQITSQKGSGESLSGDNRDFFESRFGYDFGNVNIHTDASSDNMNQSLQAKAFTTGSDIFFREGEYNPGSDSGKELLAHELTHVVQQGGADVQSKKNEDADS